MAERAYTVKEIDELRTACGLRLSWGTTYLDAVQSGFSWSRSWAPGERDKSIEEMVRTYMLAGIVAEDIYKADAETANLHRQASA